MHDALVQCEYWQWAARGVCYTITLSHGVIWHHGTNFELNKLLALLAQSLDST